MPGWSQAELDALERAIALGVMRVTYDTGKTVEYRSLSDMLSLRDRMRSELGMVAPSAVRLARFSRGL